MQEPDANDYVSYDDVERYFGISRRTLQYWIQARTITPVPDPEDNRRRLLRRADAEDLARAYTRDICQILETSYGPFDPLTRQLLIAANDQAHGLPVRGLHLMLAAFDQPWPGLPSPQTPLLNTFVNDGAVRGAYQSAIFRKLLQDQRDNGSRELLVFGSEPISRDLARALSICATAAQPNGVTVAALVRAVLQTDQEVVAIFADVPLTTRIPREQLINELDKAIPMAFQRPPDSLAMLVEPSADHRYAHRHAGVIYEILDRLAFRDPGEFVLCAGLVGSPLSRLYRILADIIDRGDFIAFRAQLGEYKHLLSLDIGALRMLDTAIAEQKLVDEIRNAIHSKSILLLRRFQLLDPVGTAHHAVDNAILRALTTSIGSAAVIAVYEQPNEWIPAPYSIYPELPILLVTSRTYKIEQTLSIIERDYKAEWQRNDHIELADNALETIFALEPATFVQGRRKTLPYLAIDLAGETIATMRAAKTGVSASLAYGMFLDASDSLKQLLSRDGEAKALTDEVNVYIEHENGTVRDLAQSWVRRLNALTVAQQDIEDVLAGKTNPALDGAPGEYETLTRSVMNAQFFGGHRYELRLRVAFQHQLRPLLVPHA
jgi:hypothetical protein